MLTIEPATQAHRAELSWRLCPEDAAELDAAGLTLQCIERVHAEALTMDGRLVCLFGVNEPEQGPAIPWMLCTTLIADVPRRAMAEVSAGVVEGWRRQHAELANLVHREHRRALRFLRFLGFQVGREPCGPGGAFYLFTWRASNV